MNINFNTMGTPSPKQTLFMQMVQAAVSSLSASVNIYLLFTDQLNAQTVHMICAQAVYAVQVAANTDVENLSFEDMSRKAVELADFLMRRRPEDRPKWLSPDLDMDAPGVRR